MNRCAICSAVFKKNSGLKRHIEGTHRKIRRHICPYPGCEKGIPVPIKREDHINDVHKKQKKFFRKSCGFSNYHSSNVKKHKCDINKIPPTAWNGQ